MTCVQPHGNITDTRAVLVYNESNGINHGRYEPMTRDVFAVWTLFVAAVVGLLGMAMFYGHAVGLSYPLYGGLLTAAVIGSAWYARREITWRNVWLFPPALLFAVMIAVRASEWLTFWNTVASMALFGLALHYMGLPAPFDLSETRQQVYAVIESVLRVTIVEPFVALTGGAKWLKNRERGDGARVIAVVRGLLLTLPVLIVFGVLLGSADAVFGEYLSRLEALFAFENIDALIGRLILAGLLTWTTAGMIAYAVLRHWQDESDDDEADADAPPDASPEADAATPPKRAILALRVGAIESTMLLGGVALLFGAFVLVQFVYLFGGVVAAGLSYAEYARRGFFELVAVSVLTMALLRVTDHITVRDGKRENTLFRVLSVVIIALVGVMLASAARRMMLYIDAFDLTHLRLWTSVFMAWLVVLFGFLIADLFRVRQNVFSLGLAVGAIGFFATMNLLNPDALIARYNIDRALRSGDELDVCYLRYLSGDAVPVIVDRFQTAEGEYREQLGSLLRTQQYPTRRDAIDPSVFAYNIGRERAAGALETVDDAIEQYEFIDGSSCYGYLYSDF